MSDSSKMSVCVCLCRSFKVCMCCVCVLVCYGVCLGCDDRVYAGESLSVTKGMVVVGAGCLIGVVCVGVCQCPPNK